MANENPSGLGTFAFNLRFPGQYFDKETNLHYNTFRDYSPEIGRYIESDPIGLRGGLNTYAYVYDNPLGVVDPMGNIPIDSGGQSFAPALSVPSSSSAPDTQNVCLAEKCDLQHTIDGPLKMCIYLCPYTGRTPNFFISPILNCPDPLLR
jgi:RHS repeat-associated protein